MSAQPSKVRDSVSDHATEGSLMEERKHALVPGRVVAGRVTIGEAALLLGLSVRSVYD